MVLKILGQYSSYVNYSKGQEARKKWRYFAIRLKERDSQIQPTCYSEITWTIALISHVQAIKLFPEAKLKHVFQNAKLTLRTSGGSVKPIKGSYPSCRKKVLILLQFSLFLKTENPLQGREDSNCWHWLSYSENCLSLFLEQKLFWLYFTTTKQKAQ